MSEDIREDPMSLIMNLSYEGGNNFLAEVDSDLTIDIGGKNPNPIEYLIAALGGCTGTTVIKGLMEKGIKPNSFTVKVEGSRRKTPPTIFEKIHVTFTLSGEMDDQSVAETIRDTMTLKCPIAVTLGRVGDVTREHHIMSLDKNM